MSEVKDEVPQNPSEKIEPELVDQNKEKEKEKENEQAQEKEKEKREEKEVKKEEETNTWKSKWSAFSAQSNDYISKKRQSLTKSMKESVSKLNIFHKKNIKNREKIKKDNEKRKRGVIEKSYQDFNKKLHIPCWKGANENEKINDQIIIDNLESAIPGHTDIIAEFDSIYIGIYPT
ncbi:hypothetical protein RFI_03520, partial [Reticulomyxa filosa]